MLNNWLHYYNNADPAARPLGRVRVYSLAKGIVYISSMRTYKDLMKKINEVNKAQEISGGISFIGSSDLYGNMVYVRSFDPDNYPFYQCVGCVESVF